MLQDFFHLNGQVDSIDEAELLRRVRADHRVENAVFEPPRLSPARPENRIKNCIFSNVSFKSTELSGLEFQGCKFEDCLFLGTTFNLCEFHQTQFTGCNPYKAHFVNTYVDPDIFAGMLDPRRHANIGVNLFQQLRSNAFTTHQPDFAESADWLFQKWRRYELNYKHHRKLIGGFDYWCKWILSAGYETVAGFGHSFRRFALSSVVLFVIVASVNHALWTNFKADSALKASHPWISSSYFTAVTLSTVGYGDITPATVCGMIVAALEAIAGFFWFALLASILVRRFFR